MTIPHYTHRTLLFCTWLCLSLCSSAYAANRMALVIGNANYQIRDGDLKNPASDAKSIAKALDKIGFDVTLLTDIKTKQAFEQATDQFIAQLPGKDIALFFYSGHGVQADDGLNYLIPTQEHIDSAYQIKHKALAAQYLIDGMKQQHAALNLVVLDACRDNPYPKASKSGGSKGLGRMDAPDDMLIAYATAPNQTASDGDGAHSPYAQALLDKLETAAHLPVSQFFNQVGLTVLNSTHDQQSPRVESSPLHQDYCFLDCNTDTKVSEPTLPSEASTEPPPLPPVTTEEPLPPVTYEEPPPSIATAGPFSPNKPLRRRTSEPEMVAIKGGCFQMGSPKTETGRDNDERPHEVCLADFEIGKYEVTKGQFAAFVAATQYQTEAEAGDGCYGRASPNKQNEKKYHWRDTGFNQTDQDPVVCVSWNDANAYVNWLNQKNHNNYHLPTEAQWEYAARLGTHTIFPWGNMGSHDQANYEGVNGIDRWEFTAPVGSFAPYKSVYDMQGNVWEWTCSVYIANYGDREKDCSGANNAKTLRVIHGGSWSNNDPAMLRPANRLNLTPAGRDRNIGFRLARM